MIEKGIKELKDAIKDVYEVVKEKSSFYPFLKQITNPRAPTTAFDLPIVGISIINQQ
jgi:hypothetical protein